MCARLGAVVRGTVQERHRQLRGKSPADAEYESLNETYERALAFMGKVGMRRTAWRGVGSVVAGWRRRVAFASAPSPIPRLLRCRCRGSG